MKKEIAIFICEDDETRDKIIEFVKQGHVTYANIVPEELRSKIVSAIEEVQEEWEEK